MTAPSNDKMMNYGDIIKSGAQGASSAISGANKAAATKRQAKEVKRQTFANLLNRALRRQFGLSKARNEYSDDMNDYQMRALQELASGFTDSFKG